MQLNLNSSLNYKMNNRLITINPNLVPKQPQLTKPFSCRNNPSSEITSKQLSTNNKSSINQNCPKLSVRLLTGNLASEDRLSRNPQVKPIITLKNTKEVFKRLSSNKAVTKVIRKPSEDLLSENSNKTANKAPNSKNSAQDISREKNSRQFPSNSSQNVKFMSLAFGLKNNLLKQANEKQIVIFESRKPTINFKGLFQQIRNNQKTAFSTKNDDYKNGETAVTKMNGILNHSNTTSSTLHAMLKSKKLKTDINGEKEQPETAGTVARSRLEGTLLRKSSGTETKSFEAIEKQPNDDKHNKRKRFVCDESLPVLRRKFVLNDNTSVSDLSANLREDLNKQWSGNETRVDFVHENFANMYEDSTVAYLIEQEELYAPDPHYIDHSQPNLKWKMRAILLDWIQEVCSDYLLKRETYYYAVNYLDRYLSMVPNVEKRSLQLIGLTCLYLAAKIEEVLLPKVENMVLAANNTYSADQIIKMENSIYFTLGFRITPPTLNTWANWYAAQWDAYVDESEHAQENVLASSFPSAIKFKQPTQQSYALYRNLMQLLDASMLDIQTLQYKQRALVLSMMYVLVGREYKQFTTEMIATEFPNSSQYLLDESFAYNNLFGNFVTGFGMELLSLLPTIQFVSSFFSLEIDISLPIAAKIDKENVLQVF